ncbi:hypothetical protein HDE_13112 [Halotydeus destructor]|nr:hypothetical protein HDE_13112 [Halotydeus destructor]
MCSKLTKFLDYDNHLLSNYVDKFHEESGQVIYPCDNLARPRFEVNETPVTVSSIEDEIKDSMAKMYQELAAIPAAGEITDPAVLAINQCWCEYIAKAFTPWHNFYASATIIYFYRRITTPEYQTPAHMRVVYAVCTAAEWYTNAIVIRDDMMDDTARQDGGTAWHLEHPKSTPNDLLLLTDMARLVMKHVVPKGHPCHGALCDELEHYVRRTNYYYAYQSWLAKANGDRKQAGTNVPLDGASMDTLRSFNWFRGEQMVVSVFELARPLACYQLIPMGPYRECIMYVSATMSIADDLRDMTPEGACEDIANGEIHDIFLPLALELGEEVPEAEAVEVIEILHTCYGTKSQSDATVVKEMYWKHKVPEKALDHLTSRLDEFEHMVKPEAVKVCNVPSDVMDFSLA